MGCHHGVAHAGPPQPGQQGSGSCTPPLVAAGGRWWPQESAAGRCLGPSCPWAALPLLRALTLAQRSVTCATHAARLRPLAAAGLRDSQRPCPGRTWTGSVAWASALLPVCLRSEDLAAAPNAHIYTGISVASGKGNGELWTGFGVRNTRIWILANPLTVDHSQAAYLIHGPPSGKCTSGTLKFHLHPSQNGCHQGNKQQQILMRKGAGKEPLHTVGGNVS